MFLICFKNLRVILYFFIVSSAIDGFAFQVNNPSSVSEHAAANYLDLRARSAQSESNAGNFNSFSVPEFLKIFIEASTFLKRCCVNDPDYSSLPGLYFEPENKNHQTLLGLLKTSLNEKQAKPQLIKEVIRCMDAYIEKPELLTYEAFWNLIPKVLNALAGGKEETNDFFLQPFKKPLEISPIAFFIPVFNGDTPVDIEVFIQSRSIPLYPIQIPLKASMGDQEARTPSTFTFHDLSAHALKQFQMDRRFWIRDSTLINRNLKPSDKEWAHLREDIAKRQVFSKNLVKEISSFPFAQFESFCENNRRIKTECRPITSAQLLRERMLETFFP